MPKLPFSNPEDVPNMMEKRFDKMMGSGVGDQLRNKMHRQFDSLYSTVEKGVSGNRLSVIGNRSEVIGKKEVIGNRLSVKGVHPAGVVNGNRLSVGGEKKKEDEAKDGFMGMGSEIKMTKLVAAKGDNSVGLVQAVAGTAIMMLLFSVVGIGASLLDEKQEGTLK